MSQGAEDRGHVLPARGACSLSLPKRVDSNQPRRRGIAFSPLYSHFGEMLP